MHQHGNIDTKKRRRLSTKDSPSVSQRMANAFSETAKRLGAAMILFCMSRRDEEPEANDELSKDVEEDKNQNSDNDHRDGSFGETSSSSRTDSGIVASASADYNRLPEFGRNIDGVKLTRFPPQQRLRWLIGECSEGFAKQLTATDVNRGQSRLSFSKEDVRRAIFPILNSQNNNRELEGGIEVSVYDPRGEEYTMSFKAWAGHKFYVLSGKRWFQLASDNNFMALRDWLNVWVFKNKINGRLCFAIDVQSFDTPQLIKRKRAPTKKEE